MKLIRRDMLIAKISTPFVDYFVLDEHFRTPCKHTIPQLLAEDLEFFHDPSFIHKNATYTILAEEPVINKQILTDKYPELFI